MLHHRYVDFFVALLAASALVAVHLLDPYHCAQHNISDLENPRAASMILLVINGMYAILLAAIISYAKSCLWSAAAKQHR